MCVLCATQRLSQPIDRGSQEEPCGLDFLFTRSEETREIAAARGERILRLLEEQIALTERAIRLVTPDLLLPGESDVRHG